MVVPIVVEPVEPVPVPESLLVLGVVAFGVVLVELLSLGLVAVLGGVAVLPLSGVVGVRPVLSARLVSLGAVVDGLPAPPLVPSVPVPVDCA